MTTRFLLLGALLAGGLAGAETAKRAITHEDFWLMKRVGVPVPSPDGTQAVFSVTAPAYDAKDQSSDLWLVAVDGSRPARQITHTKTAESGAAWSPDGARVAFTARRDGDEATQIYVLDLARGGEAERVTALSTGASKPQWSPDGTRLLFTSEVFPGAADDAANRRAAKAVKDRKHTARVYEGFPVKYWDRWLDGKKPHLFVQEARAGAPARDLFAGSALVAGPGFGGRFTESGEDLPAVWTPDGQGVVFVATTRRNEAAYASVNTQLFHVAATGGEPRALTADRDSYDALDFRPDGRALLVTFSPGGDGKVYHHARLASFPWPFDAARRTVLGAELDLSVTQFAVTPDSATIHFGAEAGHQIKLFAVAATGGPVRALDLPARGVLGGIVGAGAALVATHDHAGQPPEMVRIDPAAGRVTALTRFNADRLAPLDLPVPEHFTFTSREGRTIHNLLVRPAGFDPAKKYPLFVMIHGGPSPQFKDAWGIRWNYHAFGAPGYVVLLTNYKGSRGYSEAFGQAIQGDPLRGPADEINQAADEAIARYPFVDATRQAAGGASYGGHLSNWLQATTTRYRCFVSHAGLVNLESQWATSDAVFHRETGVGGPVWEQGPVWREQNPVRFAGNAATKTGWITPVLVTVGEQDFRVPANNTYEYWTYLQRLRVPGKLLVFPDENHWIQKGENSRFWYGEVQAWLAQHLR